MKKENKKLVPEYISFANSDASFFPSNSKVGWRCSKDDQALLRKLHDDLLRHNIANVDEQAVSEVLHDLPSSNCSTEEGLGKACQEKTMEAYNAQGQFIDELLDRELQHVPQVKRTPDRKKGVLYGRIGRPGFSFNYVTLQHTTRVELLLQTKDAKNELHRLKQNRHAIEAAFGSKLEWPEKAERRQCRVVHMVSGGYRSPRSDWPSIHHNLIDAMKRLEAALTTYIADAPATLNR